MNLSTEVIVINTIIGSTKQKTIINYINKYPSQYGKLAKKEYKRFNIITLLIIFLIIIPMIIYAAKLTDNYIDNGKYPNGATQRVTGATRIYSETFWYVYDGKTYELDLSDYKGDQNYGPKEKIFVYLDDNNNVISIAPETDDAKLIVSIILMYIFPFIILLVHVVLGIRIYAKNWRSYVKWFDKEISPYLNQKDFEKNIKNKQYYDVTFNIKDLDEEKQKKYKKYKNKMILYFILYGLCFLLTIYLFIKFGISSHSWLGILIILIYTIIFIVLIDNCDAEMYRIKIGYDEENKK